MQGMPKTVLSAAQEVLKIEGVKAVKIVPPAGTYHLHVEIENHGVDELTEFYRKVMALRAFNEAPVDVQGESKDSFRWIEGTLVEEEVDGSTDLDVPPEAGTDGDGS